MRATAARIVIATAIAVTGWSIGRAQTTVADFEVQIDAPGPGQVNLTCVRGCNWLAGRNATYFSCGGNVTRCSGVIDGLGIVVRHTDGTGNRPPQKPR